ncbi:MAG: ATP-binding protein [Anaerolineae bacterium]|nr:ATP-binding protein [Anaerolineae bacterium]
MAGDPVAADYRTSLFVTPDGVYEWLISKADLWKAHRWDGVAPADQVLFLAGERGVGKTWLLRHLAKDDTQVSPLAAYLDLAERVRFSWPEQYVEVMEERVQQQLGSEGAILLLDAVPPQIDEKLRFLEDAVLRPYAAQRRSLVIMALVHPSQVCWRTPAFQVGERWLFAPFEVGQTRKQLQRLEKAGLITEQVKVSVVQESSGGLPLLNYLLVTREREAAFEALLEHSFSRVPVDERERVRNYLEAVCLLDVLEHAPVRKMMEIYRSHRPDAMEYPAHASGVLNLLRKHWLSQSAFDSPGRMVLVGSVRRAAIELLKARDAELYAKLEEAARIPSGGKHESH